MATKGSPRFEESDLAAIVEDEIASAKAYAQSDLDDSRSQALNYMAGVMPDLQTFPNRSKQVSRDVSDVISWMLPGIVRVFTASDQMVEFEASDDGQEQWARDATEFTNYDFMRNNNGYRILRGATQDALSLKYGIVCSWWKAKETKRETLKRQTLEQITPLTQDPGVTILSQKPSAETYTTEMPGPDGFPIQVEQPYLDVRIERVTKQGHIVDEVLKPENFFINGRATDIETCRSCGYLYDETTRSDLMAMADEYDFDVDVIKELPADGLGIDNTVSLARYQNAVPGDDSMVKSMDNIHLWRYFVYADHDDDGVADLIAVWYAGGKVLAWEVWEDEIPFTDIPCYPQPHRFDGDSVADRIADIQRVKTVLLRQTLDNLYASAVPTQEVELGSVLNPDVLVNKTLGGIIWKKPSSAPIQWGVVPFFADKSMAAMQYMDEVTAKRTGVSRQTMALDPEALQNQTATASQNQRDAAYSQIELVARDMAEYGWCRFFSKRLKLAIKYLQIAKVPSKDQGQGSFRAVTPQAWNPDMAVNINVGLGTGSRDRDMSMLNNILQVQNGLSQQLAAAGLKEKALEFIPKIRKTAVELTESSGIRNPASYWPKFDDQDLAAAMQKLQQQGQQPDPQVQIEQAKLQAQQQRDMGQMQIDQQKAQQSAQLEGQKLIGQGELERAKLQQNATLERERMTMELQLKQEQTQAELALKERQLAAELNLKERLAIMQMELNNRANTVNGNQANVSSDIRVGGEPG